MAQTGKTGKVGRERDSWGGNGTAGDGDWAAREAMAHETRDRRRSWSYRVSKTVAPQQIVTMLTGLHPTMPKKVHDDPPKRQSTWAGAWHVSSRNQADKRHQHQTQLTDRHAHTHTRTLHAIQTDQHPAVHTDTHTHPSTHAELTFSAATTCAIGQSGSCVMPVATLFSFF